MKIIDEGVDPKNYEVGVLVARYQIDDLHKGHTGLIDFVLSHHEKVIIFLGVSKVPFTERNPLDFETRKLMVKSAYPQVEVFPIYDQGTTPRGNQKWSELLDEACEIPFGPKSTLLYGSRDSFIPYYRGKFDVAEVMHEFEMDATSIRNKIGHEVVDSNDFRKGCIYTCYHLRPTVYPTVDVVVVNDKEQILLVRKPNEDLFRFAGGFVDPTDANLEAAASRELEEETTLKCTKFKYITSILVDDERYAREKSKIMTTLYLTRQFNTGTPEASDDLKGGEVKWFNIKDLITDEQIEAAIMPVHRDMVKILVKKLSKTSKWLKMIIKIIGQL